ncbi:MAG: 50S ribosomal protein L18, partial [Chlamydiae bacterium]|nr:50S ribosomal protein L18 [Chlamydiota bacterium]
MESQLKVRNKQRARRLMRVRKRVRGSTTKPRFSVFRSNKHVAAQLIDDEQHTTLLGFSTLSKDLKGDKRTRKELPRELGKRFGEEAKKKNIPRVVCDRGKYQYHRTAQEVTEGEREA